MIALVESGCWQVNYCPRRWSCVDGRFSYRTLCEFDEFGGKFWSDRILPAGLR